MDNKNDITSSRLTSPEVGTRGGHDDNPHYTSGAYISHTDTGGITRESTKNIKLTGIPEPLPIIDKKYQIQDPKA
jgi:hypothetical protein